MHWKDGRSLTKKMHPRKLKLKLHCMYIKFIQPYGKLDDIIIDSKSGKMPRVMALYHSGNLAEVFSRSHLYKILS